MKNSLTQLLLLTSILLWGVQAVWQVQAQAERPVPGPPAPQLTWSVPCRVTSVYDGDTLVVEWRQTARVRLLDCWAPEIRGGSPEQKQAGFAARAHLAKFAEGKEGILQVPWHEDIGKSTTLGRLLGRVWVDGQELSAYMVEAGLAEVVKPEG